MKNEKFDLRRYESPTIICVNSYSYDNVDAIAEIIKTNNWDHAKVYFVHYDPRAIEMHQERIKELGLQSAIEALHDDMRESKLKYNTFDLVINDFRLNFNQDHKQNLQMMWHTYRVMKKRGILLASTVVDGRYENVRYGHDQEKAPVNAKRPGMFLADEHLVRRCWSMPYYRQLFEKNGFKNIKEFDVEEGRRWNPPYRRWLLTK